MTDTINQFLQLLPQHKCELSITHNSQKSNYETVAKWESELDRRPDWVSEEQRLKAIEMDELWCCQWYPNNPVGSYCIYAADLAALLKAANE